MEEQISCAECLNVGRAVYCMQCIRMGKGRKDMFIPEHTFTNFTTPHEKNRQNSVHPEKDDI